jgi:tetratricopeptide (TPR) repeat protein
VLKDQPAANQEQAEAMPEDRWKELETLNARFDAELAYADSCLEEEPPPSDMEMLLASASELRRAAILQRFVDRVYFLRFNDPRQGLSITENILAWTEDPTPLVAVVRCRALMERGNLLRIFGEREGAYEALAAAWEELDDHGITDPLELARYEELLGTLEAYSGNFARARHLLTEAILKVRRWGDNHSLQRVLISAGLVELRLDNFDLAQSLFEEAIRTAEPESLLLLCAATNRVLGYFVSGQPQLAYREICRLRARFGD